MTCDDYLAMLETLPVEELNYGDARQHAAACRDCNRVTRVVAERERNMIVAYGDLYPSASSVTVAEQAILTSRRRTVAVVYRTLLIGAAAAVVLFVGISRIRVPRTAMAGMMVRQTFMPRWCTAEQASAMLEGMVSPAATISVQPAAGVLHVTGRPSDLRVVRSTLDRYDTPNGGGCSLPIAVRRASLPVP